MRVTNALLGLYSDYQMGCPSHAVSLHSGPLTVRQEKVAMNLCQDLEAFDLDCCCHVDKQSGGLTRFHQQLEAVAASGYSAGALDRLATVAGEVITERASVPEAAGLVDAAEIV